MPTPLSAHPWLYLHSLDTDFPDSAIALTAQEYATLAPFAPDILGDSLNMSGPTTIGHSAAAQAAEALLQRLLKRKTEDLPASEMRQLNNRRKGLAVIEMYWGY